MYKQMIFFLGMSRAKLERYVSDSNRVIDP